MLCCLFNLKHRELLPFSPAVAAPLLRDVVVQWKDNTSNKDNEDNNKDIKEIIYEGVSLMKQPQGGFQCGGFVWSEFTVWFTFFQSEEPQNVMSHLFEQFMPH
jgi:hypothetical protein